MLFCVSPSLSSRSLQGKDSFLHSASLKTEPDAHSTSSFFPGSSVFCVLGSKKQTGIQALQNLPTQGHSAGLVFKLLSTFQMPKESPIFTYLGASQENPNVWLGWNYLYRSEPRINIYRLWFLKMRKTFSICLNKCGQFYKPQLSWPSLRIYNERHPLANSPAYTAACSKLFSPVQQDWS